MVKRSKQIRAAPEYFRMREILRKELGSDLTDPKITKGISTFIMQEKILPVMIRREKRHKRGRLF